MARWNKPRLRAERTLVQEQVAQSLALSLHLTLAQALGLIARYGVAEPRLYAAARKTGAS
jgi:hypothetical protein